MVQLCSELKKTESCTFTTKYKPQLNFEAVFLLPYSLFFGVGRHEFPLFKGQLEVNDLHHITEIISNHKLAIETGVISAATVLKIKGLEMVY